VNHNVEKPCPAAQQVESAATENYAGPINRQFGNEAALDLLQACPTIALVLNKQQISSRYTFGAYSSYYSS